MATNENQKIASKLSELVKKREFTIGVLTVAVVATIGLLLFRGSVKQPAETDLSKKNEASQAMGNNGTVLNPTGAPQQIQVPEIKKLADTFGEYTIVVQNSDNYWKISERSCGTGRYYLSIQAYNNSKPLHPGDTVLVRCEE